MARERLLIVEDDEDIRTQLSYALQDEYDISVAGDRAKAVAAAQQNRPEIVTLDLGLPPSPDTAEEGLRALEEILAAMPDAKIIVLTGNGERANAVAAVERGAFDYHLKPVNLDDLKVVLRRAAYLRQLERESAAQSRQMEESIRFTDILGSTPKMREIFSVIQRVAKTDATVLCEGESGTGKELVAQAVHTHSPRHAKPFVAINCGAIPETLLESELFGHLRGAFTDASAARVGLFVQASGGTLFLDEIGDLPIGLQPKLTRALQERVVRAVGGKDEVPFDVHLITATNQDLRAAVAEHRFREDLFFRVAVIQIELPPLRARGTDVLLLAQHFVERYGERTGKRVRGLSRVAAECLLGYPWPGNVRELQNCIERAVALTMREEVGAEDLPEHVRARRRPRPALAAGDPVDLLPLEEVDRRHILRVFEAVGRNQRRAAQLLGIDRKTLAGKLARYGAPEASRRGARGRRR